MNVIYSASPLGAFSNSLFLMALFFVLGFGNLLLLLLTRNRRRKRKAGDYVLGFLSLLLLLFGAVSAFVTFNTYRNGDKTVQVQVLEKRESTVKCGKYYCTEYGVETGDREKRYVFGLSQDTWDEIEVDACYRFIYYPLKPLLAEYLQEENARPGLYETTGYITLIERVNCR